MARSSRSRSPLRRRSPFSSLKDEELPILSPLKDDSSRSCGGSSSSRTSRRGAASLSPTPTRRKLNIPRPGRQHRSDGFSKMGNHTFDEEMMDSATKLFVTVDSSIRPADTSESPRCRFSDNCSDGCYSPRQRLSRSTPKEGMTFDQFFGQRKRRSRDQDQRRSSSKNKIVEPTIKPCLPELPSMMESTFSNISRSKKINLEEEQQHTTTDVFVQLQFTGGKAQVQEYVGLAAKSKRHNGIVAVKQHTAVVSRLSRVAPSLKVLPSVRVGVTNSAA